jgi:hypothetical protein
MVHEISVSIKPYLLSRQNSQQQVTPQIALLSHRGGACMLLSTHLLCLC